MDYLDKHRLIMSEDIIGVQPGKRRLIPAAVFVMVAVVVFLFCYNATWLTDDIRFQYAFVEQEGSLAKIDEFNDRIESVADIINSQNVHYKYWGGRYLTQSIVHLYDGILGHMAFALSAAIVYVAFIMLILRLCGVDRREARPMLTVALLSLLCFTTCMTPSFQVNYIWMYTIVMAYLVMFFSKGDERRWWMLVLMGLFSIVAGEAHESINIGVGGALIAYWLCNVKGYTRARYVMTLAFGAGALILVLAPGNFARLGKGEDVSLVSSLLSLVAYSKASYLLAVVVLWLKLKRKSTLREIYLSNSFFWNVWAICIAFSLVIGVRGDRQLFGAELMAVIMAVRLLPRHALGRLWLVALSVVLLFFWFGQAKTIMAVKSRYEKIVNDYAVSTDGVVYYDDVIPVECHILNPYVCALPTHGILTGADDEWGELCFVKRLHASHSPEKPLLRLLPSFLENKDSVDLGNRVVPLGAGVNLLLQSVADPARFYVERRVDLPGAHRIYEPLELSLGTPIKETALWRAYLAKESDYTIYGLSDNKFVIRK